MVVLNLPPEILQNIFSKLSTKDFTDNVRFVYRRWCKAAQLERIILNPPTNDKFKELLIDLEKNPLFASSIKELELINDLCVHSLSQPALYEKHPSTVFEHCSNLLSLELRINCIQEMSDYLNQIQETALDNKLKLQDLYLDIPKEDRQGYHSKRVEPALNQLLACLNPQLRFFTADSSIWHPGFYQDDEEHSSSYIDYIINGTAINFVYQDIGNNDNTVLLEEFVIEGKHCTISRECLKYIISGKLPHLKVLELDLKVLGAIDGRKDSI